MKPKAVFLMGGPAAGKGHVRAERFASLPVVDCDLWKQRHPDYDPKNPAALHEWSSTMCTKEFFARLGGDETFVYDGTGTNAERYADWMIKAKSAGFDIQLVYVRCPLSVALVRNANRKRVVPEWVVRGSHEVIETSFKLLAPLADVVTVVENG